MLQWVLYIVYSITRRWMISRFLGIDHCQEYHFHDAYHAVECGWKHFHHKLVPPNIKLHKELSIPPRESNLCWAVYISCKHNPILFKIKSTNSRHNTIHRINHSVPMEKDSIEHSHPLHIFSNFRLLTWWWYSFAQEKLRHIDSLRTLWATCYSTVYLMLVKYSLHIYTLRRLLVFRELFSVWPDVFPRASNYTANLHTWMPVWITQTISGVCARLTAKKREFVIFVHVGNTRAVCHSVCDRRCTSRPFSTYQDICIVIIIITDTCRRSACHCYRCSAVPKARWLVKVSLAWISHTIHLRLIPPDHLFTICSTIS